MRALGMQVYGVHRTPDGKAFIETELFAGSLAEKLALVPMDARAAVARHSLGAMLTQLAALHAQGSVHRDIKNANLLFNTEGRVQIADPGLLITAKEIAAHRGAGASGTPCFMPPENFSQAAVKPGPGVDTWAAGCAFLEQLTHRWPLGRTSSHLMAPGLRGFEDARQAFLQGHTLPTNTWGDFLAHARRVDPEGTHFVLTNLMTPKPAQRAGAADAARALKGMALKNQALSPKALARSAIYGLERAAGEQVTRRA